jgi:hypothetical protein
MRPIVHLELGFGNGKPSGRVYRSSPYEENQNGQTRPGTFGQATSGPPQGDGIIGLTIIAVFLVGIGIGNILSKSTHANTNYAALDSTAQSSQ